MCARFGLKVSPEQLEMLFGIAPDFDPPAATDIRPTESALVVRNSRQTPMYGMLRWGLVPTWAADLAIGQKMINARSETLAERPAFRNLIGRRRCVIPCTCYYEWHDAPLATQTNLFGEVVAVGKPGKVKMAFALADVPVTPLAGLWDRWVAPGKGASSETVDTFTIITTRPNQLAATYHDRMPVLLPPEEVPVWLDPATSEEHAIRMLQPVDSARMVMWPVGSANSGAADGRADAPASR
jgi:putative SOS response-associated peptidase YedK